ncbi:MAG: choice-of-anchor D domain-containing protein, partial [Pseudomonadota bacterium]|nr:choice-of-anchor D domain-containing protein [Pseudomonadota bacterium]
MLDAVFANKESSNYVCLGDTFGTCYKIDESYDTRSAALKDVNGDNKLDVIFANNGENRVCLWNGKGEFSPCSKIELNDSSNSYDVALDRLGFDTDTVKITTTPTKGTAIVNEDGSITYTPNKGFSGTDTFSYQVEGASATITVSHSQVLYNSYPHSGNTLSFKDSVIHTPVTSQLRIVEAGNRLLEVNLDTISGDHASDFELLQPNFPFTISNGGDPITVTIQCTPSEIGLQTAILKLTTNAPNNYNPSYTLECSGRSPAGFASEPAPGSTLRLVNNEAAQSVVEEILVSETGGYDLTVDSFEISGADANDFKIIAPDFPFTVIDDEETQNIRVRCSPSEIGLRTATLTLNSNDPDNSVVSYDLECLNEYNLQEDNVASDADSSPDNSKCIEIQPENVTNVTKTTVLGVPITHDESFTISDDDIITLTVKVNKKILYCGDYDNNHSFYHDNGAEEALLLDIMKSSSEQTLTSSVICTPLKNISYTIDFFINIEDTEERDKKIIFTCDSTPLDVQVPHLIKVPAGKSKTQDITITNNGDSVVTINNIKTEPLPIAVNSISPSSPSPGVSSVKGSFSLSSTTPSPTDNKIDAVASSNASSEADCSISDDNSFPIIIGSRSSRSIEMECTPTKVGETQYTVEIEYDRVNDIPAPSTELIVEGTCPVQISYTPIDFGTEVVGGNSRSLQQTVYARVQDCGESKLTDVDIVSDTSEFSIGNALTCNYNYDDNDSSNSHCSYTVNFVPQQVGEKKIKLKLTFDNPDIEPIISEEFQVAKIVEFGTANLEVSSIECDFGTVTAGNYEGDYRSLVVTNTGDINVHFHDMKIEGKDAGEFQIGEGSSCATYLPFLKPSERCGVNVKFMPQSAGKKQAALVIYSDNVSPVKIPLKGTAKPPVNCADVHVTIESQADGSWNTAETWSTDRIPTADDVVKINKGHKIMANAHYTHVKALCIEQEATLES